MTLKQRAAMLRKIERELPGELEKIAKNATLRAVEEASDKTSPTGGDLKRTNTRTGNIKQSWATASQTHPKHQGEDNVTELQNAQE
mgnify:CR=1 FL=1